MAAHTKSDQHRDDLCAGGLRKREPDGAARRLSDFGELNKSVEADRETD